MSSLETGELSISARRTESLDAAGIIKLVTPETYNLFGRVNVAHIIEKANLAITLIDDQDTLVGHAAFYDHPNLHVSNSSIHWMEWLKNNYAIDTCDTINTLFLHYYVSNKEFSEGIITETVRTIFHAVPLLHFLILILPVNVDISESLSKVFEPLQKTSNYSTEYQGYVCHRHNYCPVLHIREARIEDHDDLMPIFQRNNDHLTEIYGDYFLAELIESQDDANKCVVADVNNTAVGFMSISTNLSTKLLKENFELDVFNQFAKKIEKIRQVPKVEPVTRKSPVTPDEETESIPGSPERKNLSPSGLRESIPSSPERNNLSPSGLRGSPLRSRRSVKLSSAHLRTRTVPNEEESKVEYVKEVFNVESVLCIQLFCIDEKYEARSIDFLPAVFESFPDKEYAIITVPHTVPEFPLLQVFQRASPNSNSILSQELYLFNRNGLLRSFKVRSCQEGDLENIISLTESIQDHNEIIKDVKQYNDYRRDADGLRLFAYVAEVFGQLVGICIFRQEKEIEYIRSHYNIEDFVYYQLHESHEHAHLHHFVLNPIFQHYSKYFIKEVFYLSNKSCFYYPIYPDGSKMEGLKPHSLVTCLNDLVPISARRQIIYPVDELKENAPTDDILNEQDPYALYHINRKLTLEPKVVVNLRIVVVGGSETGLSALQTLAFCPHLYFNNLTLVAETHVFDSEKMHQEIKDAFLPTSLEFDSFQQARLSLSTWVNMVKGKMTKINRKEKYVIVNGSQKVPYDQLLLCTGEQYHYAAPTGADVEQLLTTSEALQTNMPQVHERFLPNNIFVLNDLQDCLKVKDWLQESFKAGKIIIYGSTLEAYCCINGLLEYGVDGSCISHVHPPATHSSCFNNLHINDVMKKELLKVGVTSYFGFTLARWNNGEEDRVLKRASFTSDTKPLTLDCQAFFCFERKTIDYSAFKAINNCCLVFDGKLVIDTKFHTNDENIRAAGPLTKYARRYHSDNWTHANFNSKEIGTKVAESILQLFDPTLDGYIEESDEKLIPKYKQPKTIHCRLPGGYHFLHVWKPSIQIPSETLNQQADYGADLITGEIARPGEPEYFRIHLNKHQTIEDIICFSKKAIDAANYVCLYGMHERYLNNMAQRYKEGLIKDFYSFFRESWCLAIYHDRFKDFRNELREILSSTQSNESLSLEDKVRRMVRENELIGDEQKQHLAEAFIGSNCKKTIEKRLNCFLGYNKYHLPMYARPGMM